MISDPAVRTERHINNSINVNFMAPFCLFLTIVTSINLFYDMRTVLNDPTWLLCVFSKRGNQITNIFDYNLYSLTKLIIELRSLNILYYFQPFNNYFNRNNTLRLKRGK